MALSRRELGSIADFCKRTSDEYLARQIDVRQHYISTLERTIADEYTKDVFLTNELHGDLARMRETLSIELAEQVRRES